MVVDEYESGSDVEVEVKEEEDAMVLGVRYDASLYDSD
jgi:hypothetical protein